MENNRLTFTVSETAKILGIGRNSAYEAVARGEIPVVKVGKRLLVPKAALEEMLRGPKASVRNNDRTDDC